MQEQQEGKGVRKEEEFLQEAVRPLIRQRTGGGACQGLVKQNTLVCRKRRRAAVLDSVNYKHFHGGKRKIKVLIHNHKKCMNGNLNGRS